ncbi:hypothetical protein N1028_13205 [Herbiconiux sp. CPCC 203407]|uniref:Uncharacterized protein n=1 Tax=Herbiconiux oxytropis TaxID=2970915 RepID=A0AA41XJW9_9MICO|nr:hypothetical protein [Herbiconiux oxytropis]MCS5723080.1 hypothetical protein [Herbiconiux oxytropis]MCS5726851.1 hypothetical protein [Herbiconiux oxytropis]
MQDETPLDDAGRKPSPSSRPQTAAGDAFLIDVDAIPTGRFAEPQTGRQHPKGRFYRPELYSTTEKIGSSLAVKVGLVCALTIAASALIVVAVSSGAIL